MPVSMTITPSGPTMKPLFALPVPSSAPGSVEEPMNAYTSGATAVAASVVSARASAPQLEASSRQAKQTQVQVLSICEQSAAAATIVDPRQVSNRLQADRRLTAIGDEEDRAACALCPGQ